MEPWQGLTPKHRPYQGGKVLVDLLNAIRPPEGPTHEPDRYWSSRIAKQDPPAHGLRNWTVLKYAKSDPKKPFHVGRWDSFRLAQYDFVHEDCVEDKYHVTVHDDTGRKWGGGVRMEVTDRKLRGRFTVTVELKHHENGQWSQPTYNFGGRSAWKDEDVARLTKLLDYARELGDRELRFQRKKK